MASAANASNRFTGKVVVVTGSSRDIGQAIAAAFAQSSATVVGLARSEARRNAVVHEGARRRK